MISVVVNSRNEAKILERCLRSVVGWADEIVLIDMESTDNTIEVAKSFGAKVYKHKALSYVEPARKYAVSKTRGDWILILDPDEEILEPLKRKLVTVVTDSSVDVVKIPRLNFIFGKKIKHSNFWPDPQIRFFRKGKIKFSDKIHSFPETTGNVINLEYREDLAIRHYPYDNISQFLNRMRRYSTVEAENLYHEGKSFSVWQLIYEPFYEFVRRYIRHLGFLDGWRGFVLSMLQAYYYILVEIKLYQLKNK